MWGSRVIGCSALFAAHCARDTATARSGFKGSKLKSGVLKSLPDRPPIDDAQVATIFGQPTLEFEQHHMEDCFKTAFRCGQRGRVTC